MTWAFARKSCRCPGRPDKANLIATLGGEINDGMGGLVLAGHTDTVPFDEALWQSDPFTIKDDQDRYYGLGSCDMKGFFPVALEAAATFANQPLSAPLTVVATSDEESSMAGGRYLLECGKPKADYAIIGEPTAMQPIFAHKGISMMTIKLEGASGHFLRPQSRCKRTGCHAPGHERVDYPARGVGSKHPKQRLRRKHTDHELGLHASRR